MDVASLNLAVRSDSVKQASVDLQSMTKASTASERAAEKWGMTTSAAARSADDFSKRVQGTIKSLEFERQQLTRSAAEQAKYAALRRAGVSAMSAEGQAIAASVAALQAQRAAAKGSGEAQTITVRAIGAATTAAAGLATQLKYLAIAYISVETAHRLWQTALSAGDLGEQAEQIGINTDQLQAYRLAGAQAGIETEAMDTAVTKLAKSMGAAADGNKEMIANFEKLGVKLLDAQGELRPVADVLPEVAKGVLGIGSSSQRTATLMELFGRSGAKMATVLEEMAKGNDHVIASARQENAIISPAAIAAWDALGDRMTVSRQKWATLVGEFGARFALPLLEDLNKFLQTTKEEIEGIIGAWNRLMGVMRAARESAPVVAAQNDTNEIRQRLKDLDQNKGQFGYAASKAALEAQLAAREGALAAQQSIVQRREQGAMQAAGAPSSSVSAFLPRTPLGVTKGGTVGAGSPVAKGSGTDAAAKAYAGAIEGAREYILAKNAETAAVGLSVDAAARMKHEQELLNKVQSDGKVATAAQKVEIAALAAAMADADARFAHAKFLDDFKTKTEEAIAAQQIEYDTLLMGTEAAMAYRIEHEALNDARAKGITLQEQDIAKIREGAAAQAAATEKTRQAKEMVDLGKEAFSGFVTDMMTGLREGANAWETFGNAATNVLNKIADKLIQMAVDDLWAAAFPKGGSSSGGGGGGIWDLIGGWLGIGGGGGGGAMGPPNPYYGPGFANGAAFRAGNVIPFARGGIVNRPTLFPMARGMGLMGEAGPEAVVPLRKGRDGRLGVDASGAGGGGTVVNIFNNAEGTKATAKESKGPGGQVQIDVIVEAVEGKMSGRLARGQGSLGKTMEGTYGLARQGR